MKKTTGRVTIQAFRQEDGYRYVGLNKTRKVTRVAVGPKGREHTILGRDFKAVFGFLPEMDTTVEFTVTSNPVQVKARRRPRWS
jgi:hypothetical protein